MRIDDTAPSPSSSATHRARSPRLSRGVALTTLAALLACRLRRHQQEFKQLVPPIRRAPAAPPAGHRRRHLRWCYRDRRLQIHARHDHRQGGLEIAIANQRHRRAHHHRRRQLLRLRNDQPRRKQGFDSDQGGNVRLPLRLPRLHARRNHRPLNTKQRTLEAVASMQSGGGSRPRGCRPAAGRSRIVLPGRPEGAIRTPANRRGYNLT